uniref:Methyltransferase PMT26 n=1 Tax=Ananas comosus var. bracteatus TaxID=296719 RepID=A0A6V7Q762_ANACO|nr:unnamed protein product [Ananas comosus var. bracteatus]
MASGKSVTRIDIRRTSPSYCSTPTIVIFVALCLVGIWMFSSTIVVPEEISLQDAKSETKDQVPGVDSQPSGDNLGDNNGNTIVDEPNRETSMDEEKLEKTGEKLGEKTHEEPLKENEEVLTELENKTPDFGDLKQTNEGGETNKERRDTDTIGENSKKKKVEEIEDMKGLKPKDILPDGAQLELLNMTSTQKGSWSTQDAESEKEKELQASSSPESQIIYSWKLCNVTAGTDYIPCLDNEKAIKKLRSTKHYEHRERHCPEESPTCLVPLPEGYKRPIKWPKSRDKIWYSNVPHTKLVDYKGHQNWLKISGEYLTFPGGGTQFKHGALHYIDVIQESQTDIAWGKRSRLALDVGCGVASFGGYLFERDVLTMSFAPKDEHEAQVQFALERGIPAISAVMGTKRLPFPSKVFDVIHCARCRVPWHIEGGMLLLELNRLLRPGGYFVWSATPVYQKLPEDVEIWNAMFALTKSMCWKMVNKTKDKVNRVGLAIFRKPTDNKCYEKRVIQNPPLCQDSDDPDAAWNIPLQACIHKLPTDPAIRGTQWPEQWPQRLEKTPYWMSSSQIGVYGKPAPEDFIADCEHWKRVVRNSYINGMGIDWSTIRNVMDMKTVYGGFAAALREMKVWVMNIVPINSPDTLPIIYERGLFGLYHDWCESFSTYPRTYDLLHADHLFSNLKRRCKLLPVIVEVDRILRPEGKLIIRDNVETINEVESVVKSLQWKVRMTYSKDKEGLLFVQKTMWRPTV